MTSKVSKVFERHLEAPRAVYNPRKKLDSVLSVPPPRGRSDSRRCWSVEIGRNYLASWASWSGRSDTPVTFQDGDADADVDTFGLTQSPHLRHFAFVVDAAEGEVRGSLRIPQPTTERVQLTAGDKCSWMYVL